MRHGQARFGAADYDLLSPLGERQAVETGVYFARTGMRFDEVQIGPKWRHWATATAALSQMRDAPAPTTKPQLDEFAEAPEILQAAQEMVGLSPQEMSALPKSAQLRHYAALIEAWMRGRVRLEGRPEATSFRAVVAGWLRELAGRPGRGQRLLVVTSAGVIAAAIVEVLELPVGRMSDFTSVLRNASLTEIAFTVGRVSVLSFNSVAHLPPALTTGI